MRIEDCFEAADWGYVIEASILNPLHDLRFPEAGNVVFKIDTGFNGPAMVTGDIFEFLRFSDIEVPDDIRPTYGTLAGELTMRSAPALRGSRQAARNRYSHASHRTEPHAGGFSDP